LKASRLLWKARPTWLGRWVEEHTRRAKPGDFCEYSSFEKVDTSTGNAAVLCCDRNVISRESAVAGNRFDDWKTVQSRPNLERGAPRFVT
jgi:hypothetical protein